VTVANSGTYTVTGSGLCGTSTPATIDITVSPTASASITGTTTYCAGATTTLTASGGDNYLWNDATNSTTPVISVTQGSYTVTVTDANGCTATASETVTELPPLSLTISGNLTYCVGGNTTLTASASGAIGYVWDDTGNSTTPSITVTQGTYSVAAVDANNCTATASAIVTELAAAPAAISGTLRYRAGGSTALTASGGNSYGWNDATNSTTPSITVTQGP